MPISTKFRSEEIENMDDFDMKGKDLIENLDEIAKINQLLGGNKLTLEGVKRLIEKTSKSNEISIVDIGCGNGDMLRKLADYALKVGLKFNLIGIDANKFTIQYAQSLSIQYENISYQCIDVFDKNFVELKYDIVLCTLTLHHFKDYKIEDLMTIFNQNASVGIVINDLQRNIVAYRLFQFLGFIFRLNKLSRVDGLTSILRGFKKNELIYFSKKLNLSNYTVKWKWAFRYQWIIFKI